MDGPGRVAGCAPGCADQAARTDPDWQIAWCAGAGVIATAPAALDVEVVFRRFTASLRHVPRAFLPGLVGREGSTPAPRTRHTRRRPSREPPGALRLGQARPWRRRCVSWRVAGHASSSGASPTSTGLARTSQSHRVSSPSCCLTQVTGRPAAALRLDGHLARLPVRGGRGGDDRRRTRTDQRRGRRDDRDEDPRVRKILPVAKVLVEATRVLRRHPRLSTRRSPGSQVHDLRLRSVVWPQLDAIARTPLGAGLRATANDVAARTRSTGSAPTLARPA